MALENKLGITSSAELAREEERISKKRLSSFLKTASLISLRQESFLPLKQFTNIFSTISTTLPEKSEL